MASLLCRHRKLQAKFNSIRSDATALQLFLFLVTSSTVLTIITVHLLTPSFGYGFASVPFWLWGRKNAYFRFLEGTVSSISYANDTICDYSDVDQLPPAQELQLSQLLTNSEDRSTNTEDNFPNRWSRQASSRYHGGERFPQFGERYPARGSTTRRAGSFMRPLRRQSGYQLELYYNEKWEPFFPKMRWLLKQWIERRKFAPEIMQELLVAVKGSIDENYILANDSNVTVGKKYKTCAVVGNSGVLLHKQYGAFIDSHEMIMRINNARTSGFEEFVGSKTTISFINSHILRACARRVRCWCHPYGEHVPIITYLCEPWHFMPIAFCSSSQRAPLLVTDPQFDNLCNRIAKWYSVTAFVTNHHHRPSWWNVVRNQKLSFHYSSGMQAVLVALGICESVNIFGFGKSDTAKHHYHTSQSQELLDIHDYAAEYQFYSDLQNNRTHAIPFFRAAGIVQTPAFQMFL